MRTLLALDLHQQFDAGKVATTFKRRCQKRGEDFFRQPNANNAGTNAEYVCVVVRTRQACGVEVVAQCRTHAMHLVGRDLFALPAAPEHDSHVGKTVANRPADLCTNGGIVDGGGAVGSKICDDVTVAGENTDEVLLQFVAGVVGANCDS